METTENRTRRVMIHLRPDDFDRLAALAADEKRDTPGEQARVIIEIALAEIRPRPDSSRRPTV